MREVTETDLPSLLFILVYLVFLFRSMFYVLDFKLLIYVSFASNDQTFPWRDLSPTKHVVKAKPHAEGHRLKEAIETRLYIRQTNDIDRIYSYL